MIQAVLFDFGGVITTSPFDNFALLEERRGVPADTIRKINSTDPDTNAWAQYERNDVGVAGFCELFESEASALGFDIAGQDVLDCLKTEIRPFMVDAVRKIRDSFRTAMLTNNFSAGDDPGSGSHGEAKQLFEVMRPQADATVLRTRLRSARRRTIGVCVSRRSRYQPEASPGHGNDNDQGRRPSRSARRTQ